MASHQQYGSNIAHRGIGAAFGAFLGSERSQALAVTGDNGAENRRFLMVALTTDALERYREMLPALKGRLANEVRLHPIRSEDEAADYWRFYTRPRPRRR